MDHVAKLVREAEGLRRKLWASLPWSIRLAEVFTILAEAQNEPFARTMAAMFLLAGVTGMPPIKGEKPEDFMTAFKAKHGHAGWSQQVHALTSALPHGYAGVIGGAAFKQALAITRNNLAVAEDLMGEVLMKFLGGAGQHLKPVPLGTAIKLIQTAVKNLGINVGLKRQREVGPGTDPDTGEGLLAPVAPEVHSIEEMAKKYTELLLREIHTPKIKSDLEHIHPEAIKYIELLLEGKTDVEILGTNAKREIVGEPLLKHDMVSPKGERMYPALWNAKYKQRLFKVLREHLPDLTYGLGREHHTMYSYDRRAFTKDPRAIQPTLHKLDEALKHLEHAKDDLTSGSNFQAYSQAIDAYREVLFFLEHVPGAEKGIEHKVPHLMLMSKNPFEPEKAQSEAHGQLFQKALQEAKHLEEAFSKAQQPQASP